MSTVLFTLSIEDSLDKRTILLERNDILPSYASEIYDPNVATDAFDPNGPFDTSFSIVHPLRRLAVKLADDTRHHANIPVIKYDSSVNDYQRKLFENMLGQELTRSQQ